MQKEILTNEKGIALIVTISIITVLIAVALELNSNVRSEIISSAVIRDRLSLKQMAASGVQMGIGVMMIDKTVDKDNRKFVDSIQEDWADPEKINEVIDSFPFDDGKIEVTILDELAKIQVNALVVFPDSREYNPDQKDIWERILKFFVTDEESFDFVGTAGIVACMKDWLDTGDDDLITGVNGAESDYYQDLEPPYSCQNGPVKHLDELVLIKGIEPEDFYSVGELFQLSRYVTVFGMVDKLSDPRVRIGGKSADEINKDIQEKKNGNSFTFPGKININTAELPVISVLLPDGDEDYAQDLIDYREEKSEDKFKNQDLHDISWIKRANEEAKIAESKIQVYSDIYRITCTATKQTTKIVADAVIRRYIDEKTHKPAFEILSYKIDT